MTTRTIARRYRGTPSVDGAGVQLIRTLGYNDVKEIDPFLMLDYFDSTNPADYIKGFPWHPHRGIETITYLLSGELEHGDSLGNAGVIEPFGCQWMTAGSGIIHQEMPVASDHLWGAQLWLNLPREHKMTTPTYRDITEQYLAIVEDDNIHVKVIAGQFREVIGPVKGTYVEPIYLDVQVKPQGEFTFSLPEEDTVILLLLAGTIELPDGEKQTAGDARAVLLTAGDTVRIRSDQGARFLLMAGKPIKEPIAWGGPIVMNTREELRQAFDELDHGTFIRHGA